MRRTDWAASALTEHPTTAGGSVEELLEDGVVVGGLSVEVLGSAGEAGPLTGGAQGVRR